MKHATNRLAVVILAAVAFAYAIDYVLAQINTFVAHLMSAR